LEVKGGISSIMLGAISQSGNTPTMYNPIICFDASDTSASNITGSSNKVSLIKDRSGSGNDGVEGAGSAQPGTNTNTINGLNTINFSVGDRLSMSDVATTANLTIIAVYKPIDNNSGTAAFLSADAADNDFQIDALISGEYHGRVNCANLGATTPPTLGSNKENSVILTTYRFSDNDSDVTVRLNGTEVGSDTYDGSMASSLNFKIAANRASTRTLVLDLGELLIFPEDLSATQIDTIETYLTDKWGVV
jgi:hypothetical protein